MMTFDQVYDAFAGLTKEDWENITAAVVEAQYDGDFVEIGRAVFDAVEAYCNETDE